MPVNPGWHKNDNQERVMKKLRAFTVGYLGGFIGTLIGLSIFIGG